MRFLLNCLLRRAFNIYQCLPSIFYSLAQHMKLHSITPRTAGKEQNLYLSAGACCTVHSSFHLHRAASSAQAFLSTLGWCKAHFSSLGLKKGREGRGKRVKSKEHGTGGHSGVLHAWGQDPLFYTLLFMSVIFSNSDHPLTIRTSQHTAKSNRA